MFAAASARHRARPEYLRRLTSARRVAVLGLAIVVGGISAGFISGTAQAASTTPTQYAAETFTDAQLSDPGSYRKLLPTSNTAGSAGLPCLTAGSDTAQSPIQGCTNPAIDSATGALRFTNAKQSQASGVGAKSAIPLAQGLDATFESYQYGGDGADGIAFYLAAADPYELQTPTSTGALGGALGYSYDSSTKVAGIDNGYLGLGLDQFGNYQKTSFGDPTCSTGKAGSAARVPNVTVRGPGNGSSGYCVLSTQDLNPLKLEGTTRDDSDVPVEVLVNTSATETLTSTGIKDKLDSISVGPRSYAITFKALGSGAAQQTVSGTLPMVAKTDAAYHDGWYDAAGYPYKLTYGWTSSTGGNKDVHEINRFVARSLNGAAPSLTAKADDSSVAYGGTGTYTFRPAVAGTGGAENGKLKITTDFPSGIAPQSGSFTAGPDGEYSCTTTAQQVVCTTPTAVQAAAGATLPPLSISYTDSANANTPNLAVASTVASTDALASASAGTTITVTQIPTTTTLTSSPNPSTFADRVTLTATIDQKAATGSVTFTDTTTKTALCSAATVTNGVATCTTTALGAGDHSITAAFTGDTNYAKSATSAPLVQTVAKKTGALTLGANPSGKAYGNSSTLTATLPASEKDATGTVTFTGDDHSSVDADVKDGVATITTPADAPVGTVTYTAVYGGDADHEGATSNTTDVVTSLAPTAIGETVDGTTTSTITYGGTAKLAATDLPTGATGTVTFTDATKTELCSTTIVDGAASCDTATDLGAGTYEITANYGGDARYAASWSSTVELVVQKATVAITATATPATISYGEPTTFGVTSLPADATGTVSYTLDGAASCTATLPDTTCEPATAPAVGDHALVATWSGDADHDKAVSPAVTVTVTKATPTIGETVNDGDSASVPFGTAATLVATELPTGAANDSVVTFTVGDDTWCTTVAANATCPTSDTLPVGTYSIVANWAGDANHEPASSEAVTLTVTQQGTTIAGHVNEGSFATITQGETADLTATGLPKGATGTVTYHLGTADGEVLATGDASEQGAPATTAAKLRAGDYEIVAVYSGDDSYAGSVAEAVELVVAHRTLTDTVNGKAAGSTTYGTPATLEVGGIPAGATGSVVFSADGTELCTATLPTTSCDTSVTLPAGTYAVDATYTGDDDNEPSTTAVAATLTVAKAAGTVAGSGSAGGSGSGAGSGSGSGQPGGSGGLPQSGGGSAAGDVTTTFGNPVTLTPSGLPDGATGTVTFVDQDGKTLCSVDLTAGETSCAIPADQPVGTYTVTPTWSGDANHAAATGAPFTVVVTKAPTQVTVAASAAVVWGGTTTLTIGGLPAGSGGAGGPGGVAGATGSVTLHARGTAICTITLPATSCTTSALLPGTTVVTADYSGDASYAPSSATTKAVVTASHTIDPTVVQTGSSNTGTATWPSVPGAGGVTVVISPDRGLTTDPRTITVDANHPHVVTVDGLDPDTQYWYRVTTTSANGTVLSTHDGTFRTAAVALTVAGQELAFTGSSFSIGLVSLGGVLLLVAGALFIAAAVGRRRAVSEAFGPRRSGA